MRKFNLAAVGVATLIVGITAKAVTIDLVSVGNPGNAANNVGVGAVAYNYQIGRTEVSNAQYVEFLNTVDPTGANTRGLYSPAMSAGATVSETGGIDFTSGNANGSKYSIKPGKGNNPVTQVSWSDAARFVNWLHNGQGAGTTELGVYNMSDPTPVRSANATYVLPNANEWVKAAHYDPNKSGSGPGYWNYATRTDTMPTSTTPPGMANPTNSANFLGPSGYALTGTNTFDDNQSYLTNVGAYPSSTSFYGTLDQNGNVYEWDETLSGSNREMRGGSWNMIWFYMVQTNTFPVAPESEGNNIGFRVALVPEPSALALLGALFSLAPRRRSTGRYICISR